MHGFQDIYKTVWGFLSKRMKVFFEYLRTFDMRYTQTVNLPKIINVVLSIEIPSSEKIDPEHSAGL